LFGVNQRGGIKLSAPQKYFMTASLTQEKIESPVNDNAGVTSQSLVNGLTGLLSKSVDTALDIWAIRESNKNASIGSVYPTGQVNPGAAKAQVQAEKASPVNYTSWIIGGIALAVFVAGAVIISRKS
jgi:hypothetical protein